MVVVVDDIKSMFDLVPGYRWLTVQKRKALKVLFLDFESLAVVSCASYVARFFTGTLLMAN